MVTTAGSDQKDVFAQKNSISMPAINDCMSLLQEVQEFLAAANLSFQGMSGSLNHARKSSIKPAGGNCTNNKVIDSSTFTSDLDHYCREFDSALASLQLCLQIQ